MPEMWCRNRGEHGRNSWISPHPSISLVGAPECLNPHEASQTESLGYGHQERPPGGMELGREGQRMELGATRE